MEPGAPDLTAACANSHAQLRDLSARQVQGAMGRAVLSNCKTALANEPPCLSGSARFFGLFHTDADERKGPKIVADRPVAPAKGHLKSRLRDVISY